MLPLEEAFKEAYQLLEQGKKEKNHVVMKRPLDETRAEEEKSRLLLFCLDF